MAIDQDIKDLEEMIKRPEGLSNNKVYREVRQALESALFIRFGWGVSGTLKYLYGGIFEVQVCSKGPLAPLVRCQENEPTRNAIIMLCKHLSINMSEPLTPQIEEIAAVQEALDKCRQSLCNMEKVRRHLKVKFAITHKDSSAPSASASKRGALDNPQARQALERR